MGIKTEKRNVAPLAMRASLKPDTLDTEKRTVEMVFSRGAKVLRQTWFDGPFYEELDMKGCRLDRLNNGAPLLDAHNGYSALRVMGVVEAGSAKVTKGEGVCKVRFAAAGVDPEADMLFAKVRDGIVTNVSVGYRTHRVEKIVTEGEKIPTMRVVDWTPFEVSAVPMGADDGAGFRSSTAETNEVEITTTEAEQDMKILRKFQNPDDGNGGGTPAPATVAPPAPPVVDLAAARAEAAQKERERVIGINHAVRTAKLDQKFADGLISSSKTLDECRDAVLNEMARVQEQTPTDSRVTAVPGGDDRDKFVRSVSGWVFEAAGNGLVAEAKRRAVDGRLRGKIAEEFKDLDIGSGHRGMSVFDIARACLERNGVSTRGVYGMALVDLALRASSGDFAVLFENIMYKTLRAAYAVQDDTWRRFVGTDTVKDFRAANRYMNGAFTGALPVVPEDGEYTNTSIPDGTKVQISTETRGEIISLSRQALINDDMGALVDVAARFGRKASRSIELAVYEMLLDNSGLGPTMSDTDPFFDDAARANISTSAALSVAAIDADRQKMRKQTHGGDYLDQVPSILLVPVGLESAAKIINESAFDHTSAGDSNKPNPVRGVFSDIVSSPRLTSTTRRWLFTASKEAFKVVFLEGAGEGPTMESKEGFRRDGTEWKARMDFKVNPFDPKTALTNAGT